MSLTRFIEVPQVKEMLRELHPKITSLKFESPVVESRSANYMLIGTAFDYLLRFELNRLAPHSISEKWIAEHACDSINPNSEFCLLPFGVKEAKLTPEEMHDKVKSIIEAIRAQLSEYLTLTSPTQAEQEALAISALRLAKLDSIARAGYCDENFQHVENGDVSEMMQMLAIVPFEQLLHPTTMLLNPSFGNASRLLSGADADLIVGDLLIDIKSTKRLFVEWHYVDQILGYTFLARRHRLEAPSFPAIKQVGIYFSRFGLLWRKHICEWEAHPMFHDVEHSFIEEAKRYSPFAHGPG